jgi:S-(hydroxymethyl)glutathione dehydrogenase/alcohol dehydrogenase
MKSRAVVAAGAGRISLEWIELPDPVAGEVAVEITASGICHTDLDLARAGQPMVLGHEGAGRIAAIGPGVEGLQVGDAVVMNWAMPCGSCFQCALGNRHLCEQQSPLTGPLLWGKRHRDPVRAFGLGTMAEHSVVPVSAVTRVDASLPAACAAILGCGVMTGVGSVLNAARVAAGASVVVLGCGGVGLNVVQGARIAGASRIIAVDRLVARLELARHMGATSTIVAGAGMDGVAVVAAQVRALCDGRGADVAFECTAVPALAAAPLAVVRNGGTAVAVSGVEEHVVIDMTLFEWDKVYINPLYGQCDPARDMPLLVDLHRRGELLLEEQIGARFTLAEFQQAFDHLVSARPGKAVFELA